jgi:chitodextrinase
MYFYYYSKNAFPKIKKSQYSPYSFNLMKKVQLLLTATLITIAVNAQNLLTNPDFEIWSGGVPTGWTLGTTGTVSQSAITSTGVGSAFQIAAPTSTYSLSQNVLPPNGAATFDTTSVYKITVTYLVKAGDGTDARIWSNLMTSTTAIYAPVTHNDSMLYYIPLHGPGGNISPIVPGNDMNGYLLDNRATGTWHTYSYSFKFRAGIAQLAFMVRSYSASTVIWDNLYFGKATMSDIQAPMPPTGLKNTPPIDNSFYLSWNAAVDNIGVTGYDVYKDSVYYGSTPALGLTITGLTPGATYKMTVKAKDAAGNISLASMPLLVSNSVPTGLAYYATVPSGTKACYIAGDMNGWIQQPMSRMDSTHYKIYIGSALPTHGYKYCSGPDWTYVEKDAAGGEIQNRVYSASDVVLSWLSIYNPSVDITPPSAPTGLMATTPMTNTFTLSWTASTDNVGVMSYNVYKDSVFYGTTPSTSLIIIGLMPGTSCKMTVKAKDAAGNLSAASAPLIVTNQATTGVTYNVTVPAATLACYIAGEMNNWTQQPMNKVDNTHYRLIIPNALTAHAYKYCSGPDWTYVEKDNTGADIQNRVYTPADVVQAWASVYDPSVIPIAKDVTINVTVSDSVNVCYLVGTFNNWASPSDTAKMSRGIPANGKVVFSKTIYTTDANKLQFKFCAGPTWDYVQKVEVAFVYPPAESSVSVTVTSFWRILDPTKTGTIRINATVPNGTKRVWIVGGFQGWDMVKAIEGTRNASGTFSFVLHGIMATEYRLYNKPDWAYSEVGAANPTVDLPNRVASYPADSVANMTVWGWKTAVDSVADTTAPSAPTGLKSTPPTTTEFFLSWAASTDNIGVTGYEVYKDSVFYGTTSNLSLNISGLTPGKIYKMTVRAKDAAGNLSYASMPLFVTTATDNPNNNFAKGTDYHLIYLDNVTAARIPTTLIKKDYRPDAVNNFMYIWENTYTLLSSTGPNSNGVPGEYLNLQVNSVGWSGFGFAGTPASPKDMSAVNSNYTLHVAMKSTDSASHLIILEAANGISVKAAIGDTPFVDGSNTYQPYTNFTRDGNWHVIEIPMSYFFNQGLKYTNPVSENVFAMLSGGVQGTTIAVDAVYFYRQDSTITNDKIAPTIPTGLKNTPPTTNSFYLSWQPSTDNVAVVAYKVYRDSMLIGTTSANGMNINGLASGKTYKMNVKAVDAAGNNSGFSAPLFVTTKTGTTTGVTFKVTVPVGTYQCWIVGNFNNWNNNLNQMMRIDSTHYIVTLDESTFSPGVTKDSLQYKYLSGGGDWAYVEKDSVGGEIQNRRYTTGVDIVGKWNVVYNPNILPLPMDLTVSVTTPAGTNECYIVGSFNNWEGPTAQGCKMTKTRTNPDGTIVFSISGHTEDANKFIYHFCSGPDWTFEQKTPVGDFKYPIVNPVVTEWKAVYDPSKVGTIKIKATVPAGTQNVWIQGSFLGWDMAKAISGTKNNDGTFSFTIPNILSMEYKLFNQPDWNYAETDSTGNIRANRTASYPADSITNITVLGWKQTADTLSLNNFTVKIGSGGIVNQNNMEVYDGAVLSVVKGTMLTFNIIPNIGYEVETMKLNGVDVKAQLINNKFTTPAINGNVVLNVTFRKMMFSLAIRSAESGTLELFCEYGATPTFRFTPSTNWRINAVSYNNVDVTSYLANGIFTLPPVYSNSMLNVSFEYLITLNTVPASSNVKVYSNNSEIIIDGIKSGEIIRLYSENGAQLKVLKSQGNRMTISDMPNAIYLIKTETKTVKIIL